MCHKTRCIFVYSRINHTFSIDVPYFKQIFFLEIICMSCQTIFSTHPSTRTICIQASVHTTLYARCYSMPCKIYIVFMRKKRCCIFSNKIILSELISPPHFSSLLLLHPQQANCLLYPLMICNDLFLTELGKQALSYRYMLVYVESAAHRRIRQWTFSAISICK